MTKTGLERFSAKWGAKFPAPKKEEVVAQVTPKKEIKKDKQQTKLVLRSRDLDKREDALDAREDALREREAELVRKESEAQEILNAALKAVELGVVAPWFDKKYTQIKHDAEGIRLIQEVKRKAANRNHYAEIQRLYRENNIVYNDVGTFIEHEALIFFLNQAKEEGRKEAEQQFKAQMEDEDMLNLEIVKKAVEETMNGAKTRELEMAIQLEQLKKENLQLELELLKARQEVSATSTEVQQQEEEKSKASEVGLLNYEATPITYRKGLGVNWRMCAKLGITDEVIGHMVLTAKESGIDPSKGNAFRAINPVFSGAYQTFMRQRKGEKGAWKAFVQTVVGIEADED